MEVRICPNCNRAFYAIKGADNIRCYHCDYVVLDRRGVERIPADIDLTFKMNGEKLFARLLDYSGNGIRIIYKGNILSTDTYLKVDIKELSLKGRARTVWTKKISKYTSSSGLEMLR